VTIAGTVNQNDLFTIILNGGSLITTQFAGETFVSGSTYAFTSNGQNYEINYKFGGPTTASQMNQTAFETNSSGSNVALLVVPEPNSWSMLLGSLGMALGLQRFRRRRK
jgi:hypothetical protein